MEDIVTAHGLIRPLIFAVSSLVAGLLFLRGHGRTSQTTVLDQ